MVEEPLFSSTSGGAALRHYYSPMPETTLRQQLSSAGPNFHASSLLSLYAAFTSPLLRHIFDSLTTFLTPQLSEPLALVSDDFN